MMVEENTSYLMSRRKLRNLHWIDPTNAATIRITNMNLKSLNIIDPKIKKSLMYVSYDSNKIRIVKRESRVGLWFTKPTIKNFI